MLITLAIIGVVAALTIPTVVRNYQKQQTVAQLKKVYSTLSNTTNLAILDNGVIDTWQVYAPSVTVNGVSASEDFANKFLIPYLKVSKNCKSNYSGDCAFRPKTFAQKATLAVSDGTSFYLSDGTFIWLRSYDESGKKGAMIYIDVNGKKAPNIQGVDVFRFQYYVSGYSDRRGKFVPFACNKNRDTLSGTSEASSCNKTSGTGLYCAALIMKDGWQIKYDW